MGKFWEQLKLLLWKNWILRKRHPVSFYHKVKISKTYNQVDYKSNNMHVIKLKIYKINFYARFLLMKLLLKFFEIS